MKDEDWGAEMGFACSDCRFYWEEFADDDGGIGVCRLKPPKGKFGKTMITATLAGFPDVNSHDWCGSFELSPQRAAEWKFEKENK